MIAMAEIEAESAFQPGERITHHEYGQGVVLDPARDGYLRSFFGVGERRVPVGSVQRQLSRTERILRAVAGGAERGRKAWLSCEAHALPVVESASALTSARISDVSSSLDRLVRFLCAAVMQRQQKLLKVDEQTYDLMTADGARRARFTLNRDSATNQDDLELLGLDHPLVQEELGRWRSVPPEDIGIAVAGDVEEPVLLSLWMVETSAGNGERRVVVQPIAIEHDGTRVPAVERRCERYLQAPASAPRLAPEQRLALFAQAVEPALQRELQQKGAANGGGSYSAELIAYAEINSGGRG